MLIAIEALGLGNPPQGIGAYSLNLARALAAAPEDFEYLFIVPQGLGAHLADLRGGAVRVAECRCGTGKFGRIFGRQTRVHNLAAQAGARLLHATGNMLPLSFSGPMVLTLHDLDFLTHPSQSPLARRLLYRLLTPLSVRQARKIVTISNFSAAEIRRWYPRLDPAKVVVIPEGGPESAPPEAGAAQNARVRYADGRPYFLAVGSLEKRKNLTRAVEAFHLCGESQPLDVALVLAGQPGYGFREIERAIQATRERDRIHIPGYVPAGDLPGLYAGARALLILSESEGFGLPVLEAMACGCPVIAAQAGALPETCGKAALLVDPANMTEIVNAMRLVLRDDARRDELIARGRANLSRFSWARHARAVQDIYRALL